MLGFFIIFGVLFVFIGLPIIIGNLGNDKKHFVKGLIKTVAFVGTIAGLIYIGTILAYNSDTKAWNNGQHENCGQWEMFDVEKSRHGLTHYYYKCNKCGKTIELSTNFTK